MFRLERGAVVPLYIGKAGTVGKTEEKLPANMANLARDKNKFCRWVMVTRTIGDLSAAGLGHSSEKINAKYKQWAEALFVSYLAHAPVIKSEVRF